MHLGEAAGGKADTSWAAATPGQLRSKELLWEAWYALPEFQGGESCQCQQLSHYS